MPNHPLDSVIQLMDTIVNTKAATTEQVLRAAELGRRFRRFREWSLA